MTIWRDQPMTRRAVVGGALAGAAGMMAACTAGDDARAPAARPPATAGAPTTGGTPTATTAPVTAVPAQIAARAKVPVLCYHQVREWTTQDSAFTRASLVCPPANFRAQLDGIQAGGYTTITPEEYHAHLTTGADLPDKPVLLTFDDGKDNQKQVAAAELSRRDMRGTFFIMTVVLGNSGWMTKDDVKALADAGMRIGAHTWDHHDVRTYDQAQAKTQLIEPRATLAALSGQPILDLAYPFGAWNAKALPLVENAGYRAAYQLTDQQVDARHPLLTLRRQLADSTWTGPQVVRALDQFA